MSIKFNNVIRVFTFGLMGDSLKVTGKQIICMGEESTRGKMGGGMRENTSMIKNKVTGYISGQMEGNMLGNGRMGNNMEKENIYYQMGWRE